MNNKYIIICSTIIICVLITMGTIILLFYKYYDFQNYQKGVQLDIGASTAKNHIPTNANHYNNDEQAAVPTEEMAEPSSDDIAKGLASAVKANLFTINLNYNPKNKKQLYVFSDPNCHYCIDFHVKIKDFLKKYKNVNVIVIPVSIIGRDNSTRELTKVMCKGQNNFKDINLNKRVNEYMRLMELKVNNKLYDVTNNDFCETGTSIIVQNNNIANLIRVKGTPSLYNGKGEIIEDISNIDAIYNQL